MIPKVIHYCWFGRGPKPSEVERCMASWKRYLPDYTFQEWNEDNFDYAKWDYAREAYEARKFAFVSDLARLHALYTEGGIYLDTDVELLGSLNPFLEHVAFSGFEGGTNVTTGLMGAEKGSAWIKEFWDLYADATFVKADGTLDVTPNVRRITEHMVTAHRLRQDNTFQDFPGLVTLYPQEYFSPLNPLTRKVQKTKKTVAIHHYMASWETNTPVHVFRKLVIRTLGVKAYDSIRRFKLKLFPKPW